MKKPGALRRESPNDTSRFLCVGPFTLDLYTRHVSSNETQLLLPPCAFDYLATLVRNSPHPVSYQGLVLESQGYHLGKLEAQDLARSRIYLLRKVIEPDSQTPQYILAVAGYGYRLAL